MDDFRGNVGSRVVRQDERILDVQNGFPELFGYSLNIFFTEFNAEVRHTMERSTNRTDYLGFKGKLGVKLEEFAKELVR